MAPRYFFRNTSGDFQDITDRCRLYQLDVTSNAEETTFGQSTIVVDDPDGTLVIGGHRGFFIREDTVASSSNQRIYTGYTAERVISRGPFRNGLGRIWTVSLVDVNTVIERKVLRGSASRRPAESDVARMQWVEATAAGSLIDDSLYLSTANPVQMDAVDYRGQRVADVVNDCMQASGKNSFVWVRELGNGDVRFSLFYDYPSANVHLSDVRLSNVLADVESDPENTFAIYDEATLSQDPSRVYSGVYLEYDGGRVYEERQQTEEDFALGGRDAVVPAENVKSQSKATARAQRYLLEMASEEEVVACKFLVPTSYVNRLKEGMLTQFKASHLPGYEEFTPLRVLNRNVVAVSETHYEIGVELSTSSGQSVEVDCGEYANTPGGTYSALGSRVTNDDAVVYYLRAGVSRPNVPTPGFIGNWHFPDYNPGGTDYAGDCTTNEVMFMLVGAAGGTLTINTANLGPQEYFRVRRLDWTGSSFDFTTLDTLQPAGTPYVVDIDWTDAENCIGYVAIDGFGQNPSCGSKLGFVSAVWAP
jgi:hypothetical protein